MSAINNIISSAPLMPMPPAPRQRSPVFKEMTRRIDRYEMEDILETLPSKEKHMASLRFALDSHNWNHDIFHNEFYPHYALEALDLELGHPSKLTRGEFALIMRYWKARQDFNPAQIQAIPLFHPNGTVNQAARAMIKETMHLFGGNFRLHPSLFNDTTLVTKLAEAMQREDEAEVNRIGLEINRQMETISLLTEEQIDELFERMRDYPKSLQQFFKVPDPHGAYRLTPLQHISEEMLGGRPDQTIDQEINYRTALNFFSRLDQGGKLIVPPTLMQTFLHVKFGRDAVDINPVLGLSSEKDIQNNGLERSRDCAFHFPGVPMPETADQFPAPGSSFTDHDYFHAYMCSCVPVVVGRLYSQITKIIELINKPGNRSERKINALKERFIDLEATTFRSELRSGVSINDLFWIQVNAAFDFVQEHGNAIDEEDRLKVAGNIAYNLTAFPEIRKGPEEIYMHVKQHSEESIIALKEGLAQLKDVGQRALIQQRINQYESQKTHPVLATMTSMWKKRFPQ